MQIFLEFLAQGDGVSKKEPKKVLVAGGYVVDCHGHDADLRSSRHDFLFDSTE
jgi:hypothetical protein